MNRWDVRSAFGCAAAVGIAAAASCGGTSASGTGGGTAGSSSSATSSSHSASSSTGTGGTGVGTGGAGTGTGGTGAGTGGSGDAGVACLPATAYAGTFTIKDATFCAVAVYTASEAPTSQPSWGSHHGPLTVVADATGGGVTLERWAAPTGATGTMTKTSVHVAAGIPSGAYLNSQANDLPFFSWTAISWTGPSPSTAGQIALIDGSTVAVTYTANGPYWLAGVSDGAAQGRLLYTGLSALGAATTSMNGLYAADACSSPSPELGAGQGCASSQLVDAWDEYSGPVVLDKNGDAFAVLTSATAGTQEARGYAAAQVSRGAPAAKGATLFTVPGYSGSLAALAPTASAPGVVVFQPFDATTYFALDVIEQAYTVSGGALAASGTPATLLTVPTMMSTGASFMTDEADHLWVAVAGTSSTTYVVLQRAP